MLEAVAGRLKDRVHEGNTAARVGGDEFAVIVEDIEEIHEAVSLVGELLAIFEESFEVEGREIPVRASIGIAARPPSVGTRLLSEAEFATSTAKARGGNSYQFYTEEMKVQASERLSLERSLRRALERDEYVLYYQPQVDLSTGGIFGAETLLRWRHPEMGLVPPFKFIPVLEETGMISEVGNGCCARPAPRPKSGRIAGSDPFGWRGKPLRPPV